MKSWKGPVSKIFKDSLQSPIHKILTDLSGNQMFCPFQMHCKLKCVYSMHFKKLNCTHSSYFSCNQLLSFIFFIKSRQCRMDRKFMTTKTLWYLCRKENNPGFKPMVIRSSGDPNKWTLVQWGMIAWLIDCLTNFMSATI